MFIKVLDRLVDLVVSLGRYAQAVHTITLHQDSHPQAGMRVSGVGEVGGGRSTGVRVLCRSSKGVVLALFDGYGYEIGSVYGKHIHHNPCTSSINPLTSIPTPTLLTHIPVYIEV
ncbi:hypothetical protein EON63_20765, partial [archaeon]